MDKPKGNTSVRDILNKPLPPHGDFIPERYNDPEPEIKKKVSFSLSTEEKMAIYQDVKFRIQDGNTPDQISKDVVACMEEHLKEKEQEAYGNTNSKLKGGKNKFKRVE
jgi:hypothetical protein